MEIAGGRESPEEIVISVIMVNYNGMRYLADCIESVHKNITENHEIIVVDNRSIDGSVAFIQKRYPEVILIACDDNKGFGYGNNIGAEHAKGKYMLLLNIDTILLSDIGPAIAILKNNEKVGMVGAMMLGDRRQYRFSAGYFPSPWRVLLISRLYKKNGHFRRGTFTQGIYSEGYVVDWVEASFMLTRKSIWETVKGMDETYFMYGEDVDYCKKVNNLGFFSVYCPDVQYVHFGGYITARFPMAIKGLRRFNSKFHKSVHAQLFDFVLKCGLFMRIVLFKLFFFLTGNVKYKEMSNSAREAIRINFVNQ